MRIEGAVVKRGNQTPQGRDSGLFSYLLSINLQLGSLIPDLSEWGAVSVVTNTHFDVDSLSWVPRCLLDKNSVSLRIWIL